IVVARAILSLKVDGDIGLPPQAVADARHVLLPVRVGGDAVEADIRLDENRSARAADDVANSQQHGQCRESENEWLGAWDSHGCSVLFSCFLQAQNRAGQPLSAASLTRVPPVGNDPRSEVAGRPACGCGGSPNTDCQAHKRGYTHARAKEARQI